MNDHTGTKNRYVDLTEDLGLQEPKCRGLSLSSCLVMSLVKLLGHAQVAAPILEERQEDFQSSGV